jgi:small nuclear ribonucleoprotein G
MATSKFQKGPDLKRFMVSLKSLSCTLERECVWISYALRIRDVQYALTQPSPTQFRSWAGLVSHLHLHTSLTTSSVSLIRILMTLSQDKRLKLVLNGKRKLLGTLCGYDAFLNVVLEDAESDGGVYLGQVVIRGNSIVQLEALERVA